MEQKKLSCKFHNELLTAVEQHIIACSKCFPLALMHALRQIRHWSIAWSVTLRWMPNQSDTASTITNLISWFSVFDFTKNIKHAGDEILMCASLCQKLSLYCTILQSYCTNKKGAIFYESQCSLDSNETRNDGGLGMAVASAGPHANNLYLAPDRQPHQCLITHFYRPDAPPDAQPTMSMHWTHSPERPHKLHTFTRF